MSKPTLEELRNRQERQETREMETEMALRWAKDWLLCRAAGDLLERLAKLPEDIPEDAEAHWIIVKMALRELWHTYDPPPDWSYPRPFYEYEPPEDFDFGAIMQRMHEEAAERWREEHGDLPEPGSDHV